MRYRDDARRKREERERAPSDLPRWRSWWLSVRSWRRSTAATCSAATSTGSKSSASSSPTASRSTGQHTVCRGTSRGCAASSTRSPDFHWDLRHLLVDGSWLSAHLVDTGTTQVGRPVSTQELAIYRIAAGKIAEVFGDLDHRRLVGEG
jgi:predicted ester cyclase